MGKNGSYRGGSTAFDLRSDWVARDKPVDAETIIRKEMEAELDRKANQEWFMETDPSQNPDQKRETIGVQSRELLCKEHLEGKKSKKNAGGNQ